MIPWREVRPVPTVNGDLAQALATVDALQRAWQEAVATASHEDFTAARYRSLRRHAIETGIIERLYDVEWGVTEALVAEGLTAEVAARNGGVDEDVLEIIRSQFGALTFLADAVRDGEDLSITLVRRVHTAICGRQATYDATTAFGRPVKVPLRHGAWKEHPNHVRRPDDTTLEYVPPEHVQSEMDRLLVYYRESVGTHPVVRAAWLHHAFIGIHPFEDGNGRVARALTLLVLLRSKYAPLVVDRFTRADYIAALDRANDGDLRDLVRLFARLEIVALRSELERPARPETDGAGAVDVARSYVGRLRAVRQGSDQNKKERAEDLARRLQNLVVNYLTDLGESIRTEFSAIDEDTRAKVHTGAPPQPEAHWWRAQIIRAAREADFFVNLRDGTWWTNLRLRVLKQTLRFVAVIQKVGHGETGVLALTVLAEIVADAEPAPVDEAGPGGRVLPVQALRPTETESATFVYTDEPEARWPEVAALLDHTLAAALAVFADGLD
ncbi:hypothetical protein BL254_07600 [Protofrankia sp. BMG5.30]|uniref:Fido domain-containing protein n=1 Tax=Protofrankia coriariae TaxID=1562887 RepID=A0ABR5F878_9ACTN|nr:hypothetical protein FrCorBMG51_01395 [Protofrankia coriariae]ONH36325.1 hypothetical protein BL254_07600 [Protofrankia sp. BMG5.30]